MKILIADDDTISLRILKAILIREGYEVEAAGDGHGAFQALLRQEGPRLAILDWVMPEMSGIDICKKIKALDPTRYIILLTSIDEPNAISTALLSGADDFIAKPFKQSELKARLEVGKRMVLLYDQLSEANLSLRRYATEMERLAQEKAHQLIHAERLSAIGLLTAGVAHEINNPTTFISGNVQTLQKFWTTQEKWLKRCPEDHPDHDKVMFIIKETPETLKEIQTGASRISAIVQGLKTFARQDAPHKTDFDLHHTIEAALLLCWNMLKYNVKTEKFFAPDLPLLHGDPQKIEQVFVNLFSNAADAMEGMTGGGNLTIRTERTSEGISVFVLDNGPGLPDKAIPKIWEPFFTTKPIGKGTGLGLSISRGIIESHGGTITVGNRPEGGAIFQITLPLRP